MKENPIRDLLAQGNWGEDQALLQGLRQWQYAPVLWQAYETLQEEALFHSQVHGPGHIHRVLLLAALTGQTGEALVELQAAVTAHSRPDREMASIVASFQPRDLPHAMALTRLLKDADNLDRVRLGDLDPKFLRHDSAKDLVGFAQRLFQRDQAAREP